MEKTIWTHLYRIWLTKEIGSRGSTGRRGHCALTNTRGHVSRVQPHKTHTTHRSALYLPRNDTRKNRPKPDSVAVLKRRSAWSVTAARRNTPPRFWSKPSMMT